MARMSWAVSKRDGISSSIEAGCTGKAPPSPFKNSLFRPRCKKLTITKEVYSVYIQLANQGRQLQPLKDLVGIGDRLFNISSGVCG